MDEQETDEGDKKVETTPNTDDGSKSETAKDTERIRAETDELNKAIAEKEQAEARAKLGGVSSGNSEPKEEEQSDKDFVNEIMGRK